MQTTTMKHQAEKQFENHKLKHMFSLPQGILGLKKPSKTKGHMESANHMHEYNMCKTL